MAETGRSREELKQYAASLEKTVAERTASLNELARHDGLTGLLNQHTFYSELRRELSRASRLSHSTVLIYFDLDGFKQLNDTEGHKVGDEMLKTVADAMKNVTREDEIIARYGGDEFCTVLSSADVDDGRNFAKRLIREIEKSTQGTGVACSIGISASTPEKTLDVNSLVKQADAAMYEAKKEKGFAVKIAGETESSHTVP